VGRDRQKAVGQHGYSTNDDYATHDPDDVLCQKVGHGIYPQIRICMAQRGFRHFLSVAGVYVPAAWEQAFGFARDAWAVTRAAIALR